MKRGLAVLLVIVLCLSSFAVRVSAAVLPGEDTIREERFGRGSRDSESEDDEDDDDLEDGDEDTGDELVPCVTPFTVAADLSNVENSDIFWFSDDAKAILAENGFFVNGNSYYSEFFEVYQNNVYEYTPSFVTVDSMMHLFHLYFAYLLKTTEKNFLTEKLTDLCDCMLDVSLQQVDMTEGTDWYDAALRNVAFFDVAFMLLYDDADPEDLVADKVEAELELIMNASSMTESPIFGANEDYSQYKPRGYYEGDEDLEGYFRAMMWLGRMNFKADDEDMTKSAILITHALKELYAEDWQVIYDTTAWFAGTSDDPGYEEYNEVLKNVCGDDYQQDDFMNDEALSKVMEALKELPPPAIASTYSADDGIGHNICFRFMGQRFTLDAAIMQKLVSPEVPGRGLPSTLDFLAALGADAAKDVLADKGTMQYPNYEENLDQAEDQVEALPDEFWESSIYAAWEHALLPVLEDKDEGYPFFMQTDAWELKNLETYAGSFAELKHDTVLYSKQVMAEGDWMPEPREDHGYVEPEYEVYGRLAALAAMMLEDLDGSGLIDEEGVEKLTILKDLAERLEEISVKELLEETITDDDYAFIRSYGETLQDFWYDVIVVLYSGLDRYSPKELPAAVITDIATDADTGEVLEIGVGNPNTIYVVVPVDGKLRIACGAVFSYYEFAWDASDRLTDSQWRVMQGYQQNQEGRYDPDSAIGRPNWTRSYRGEAPDPEQDNYPPIIEDDNVEEFIDEPTEPAVEQPTEPAVEPTQPAVEPTQPENGGTGSKPYDYSALDYAGRYVGMHYIVSFSAYTYVDNESAPDLEIGNVDLIFDGSKDTYTVHVFDWPDSWDYDAVYVIHMDYGDRYLGIYEENGKILMDLFDENNDYDYLELTEHYYS
ncbi:MAG: DUF3160 domain-containing protein [Lachnospiraceae bacterium]|nr:DUF3160 domain-containing protein [Lachnospiraceae bacterium]